MKALFIKIYMVVTTFFLGVLLTGTVIANENSTAISEALGAETSKVVNGTDENADTEYFKSDFKNLADLMAAGKNLVEEIEGEGAVLLKNDNETLPLAKGSKVSLFGIASYYSAYGGKGSAQSEAAEAPVTLTQGLEIS